MVGTFDPSLFKTPTQTITTAEDLNFALLSGYTFKDIEEMLPAGMNFSDLWDDKQYKQVLVNHGLKQGTMESLYGKSPKANR